MSVYIVNGVFQEPKEQLKPAVRFILQHHIGAAFS